MGKLQEVLSTLEEDEYIAFEKHLQHAQHRKDRKDLLLLQHLTNSESDVDSYILHTYGDKSKRAADAYHASQKRLGIQLQKFIVKIHSTEGLDRRKETEEHLAMAHYLLTHKLFKLGWKKWAQAEQTAIKEEQYDLLNQIYNLSIEHASDPHAPRLSEIELKRSSNRTKVDEQERINMAASLMQIRLKQIRLKSRDMDMMHILQQTLERFELEDALLSRPTVALKFARLLRSAYLSRKDFYGFMPHIEVLYEQVKQQNQDRHHGERAELLYMLSHTYYRNKLFTSAHKKLIELADILPLVHKGLGQDLRIKTQMLEAAVLSFSGKNELAIDILEKARESPLFRHANQDRANLNLNLAVYYFQQQRFADANRILIRFPNSDKWCSEHMGKEWLFKKEMIFMFVQYELSHIEIALSKNRSIIRRFSTLLKQDKYHRALLFLKAVRQFLTDDQKWLNSDRFESLHRQLTSVNWQQEDLQAMTYYAWLKSKKEKSDYYQTLLAIVQK